jgi:glutathione S-transferase
MLTLYDYLPSGNGYKVRLLLRQLGRDFTLVEKDIVKGETQTPNFLAMNPNGRIPMLVEDDTVLVESNAILFYLARGTAFLPDAALAQARVLQWMFFEQYSHEPNIATVRHWLCHLGRHEDEPAVQEKRAAGYRALGVMGNHLADRVYFVGDAYSIADIALYAYTHVAPEGGFDLGDYPAVNAWLNRVRRQPGHVLITDR